jgi:hypothetical protein
MTSLSRQEGQPKKPRVSEKAIHAAVVAHWRVFGVPGSLVATIPNEGAKGQYGLRRGLPDLMVIAPNLPIGFIELKAAGGLVSEDQADFGQLCHLRGIPWEATWGRDDPIAVLEKWGAVKAMVRQ